MASKFEKRLARMEKVLAQRSEEKKLAECNCADPKVIFRPRPGVDMAIQLREELDLTCPVHPVRRLNELIWGVIIGKEGRIPNPKMDPIIEEYRRRQVAQFGQVFEDDAEDI